MKPLAYIIWVKYHFPMKKTVFASVLLFVSAAMLSAVSLTLSDGSIKYWYEYVDSTGLDADIQSNYIHRRYSRWINILEKEISEGYYL